MLSLPQGLSPFLLASSTLPMSLRLPLLELHPVRMLVRMDGRSHPAMRSCHGRSPSEVAGHDKQVSSLPVKESSPLLLYISDPNLR